MKKKLITSAGLIALASSSLGLVSCGKSNSDIAFDWNNGAKTSMKDFIKDIKRDSGQFSKTDDVIYNDSINLLFKSDHSDSEFNAYKKDAQDKMDDEIKSFKKQYGHNWKSKWIKSLKSKGYTSNSDYIDSLITAAIEGTVKSDFGYTMETKSKAQIKTQYKSGLSFVIKGINLKNHWKDTTANTNNLPGISYDQSKNTSTVTLTADDILANFASSEQLSNGDYYVMNENGIKAFYIYNIVSLPVSVQHSLVKFQWFPTTGANNFGQEPSMANADIQAMYYTLATLKNDPTKDLAYIANNDSQDTGSGTKDGYLGTVNLLKSGYVPGFIDGMYNKIINGGTGNATTFPINIDSFTTILKNSGAWGASGVNFNSQNVDWTKLDNKEEGGSWRQKIAQDVAGNFSSFKDYYSIAGTTGINAMISKDGFHFFKTQDNIVTMIKSDLNQKVNNAVSGNAAGKINYGVLDKFNTWMGSSKFWFEMNALNLVKNSTSKDNDYAPILTGDEYNKYTSVLINTNILSVLLTNVQSFLSGNETFVQNNNNSQIQWNTKWADSATITKQLEDFIPEIGNL